MPIDNSQFKCVPKYWTQFSEKKALYLFWAPYDYGGGQWHSEIIGHLGLLVISLTILIFSRDWIEVVWLELQILYFTHWVTKSL